MTQNIPYPHPGEDLKDILDEMEISQAELSRRTGIPASRITDIIKGRRAITAEQSIRLGHFFSQTDSYWFNMQREYDLRKARHEKIGQIEKEVLPLAS